MKARRFPSKCLSLHHQKYPFFMINRALLRIKAVQVLYAYFQSDSKSIPAAEKELKLSISKAYDLYHFLLSMVIELTRYAELTIDNKRNKFRPTEQELNPNTRFIDNLFVHQLMQNEQLVSYRKGAKFPWDDHQDVLKHIYESILASDYYAAYMAETEHTYEGDKNLWRKIIKQELLNNDEFDAFLEEQSIYWNDDLEIVESFVLKTIKQFDQANGAEQKLLPMFKDASDEEFVTTLFHNAIANADEYGALIDEHTKNWELDRIAFMDILIMKVALSEILSFPTIPVNVTFNEYIEIAKMYSTARSGLFVNGVLDKIVTELKRSNKLMKAESVYSK